MNVLYQENDWVYVIGEDQREGFIPHSYCAPYTPHLGEMTLTVKKKLPRDLGIPNTEINSSASAAGTGAGGGTAGSGGGDTTNQHNTTLNSSRKFCYFLSQTSQIPSNKSSQDLSSHRERWLLATVQTMKATEPNRLCRPTVPKVYTNNLNNNPTVMSSLALLRVLIPKCLIRTFIPFSRSARINFFFN